MSKIQWNMSFIQCNYYGAYNAEDRFDVTIYAQTKSEAVEKAKKITECEYIRNLNCKVVEID